MGHEQIKSDCVRRKAKELNTGELHTLTNPLAGAVAKRKALVADKLNEHAKCERRNARDTNVHAKTTHQQREHEEVSERSDPSHPEAAKETSQKSPRLLWHASLDATCMPRIGLSSRMRSRSKCGAKAGQRQRAFTKECTVECAIEKPARTLGAATSTQCGQRLRHSPKSAHRTRQSSLADGSVLLVGGMKAFDGSKALASCERSQ